MIRQLIWPLVGAVALAAGIWVGNSRLQNETPADGTANAAALPKWTSFTFQDSRGVAYPLQQLEGRIVVVNFWATWCPPCVEEMPDLERLYPKLRANNIELIGIGIDSPSNIQEFLQKRSFSYPLLVAGAQGSDLARLMGNSSGSLPYTVVLGQAGQVTFSKLGRITTAELAKATGIQE